MNGLAVKMLCENDPRFSWDIVDFSTDDKPGAYCIYEEKSGTVYVGRAANCHTRLSVHKSQLKRGVHYNRKLQSAHNNGGDLKKFVIEYCETMPTTNLLEVHWTRFFKSHGKDVFNQVVAYAEPLSKHSTSEECASMAASLGYLDNVDSHTRRLVLSTDSDPFIQSGEFGNIDLPLKRIETQSETSIALNETMGATQVTRGKHGAATIQWAESMLSDNVPPAEVARKTGIKPGYARTLKFRLTNKESSVSEREAREREADMIVDLKAFRAVSIAETPTPTVSEKAETPRFKMPFISGYEAVYYIIQGITCIGVVTALGWVGVGVAVVYFGIATSALLVAKKENDLSRSSDVSMTGVIMVELFVGLGCHIVWANEAVWANLDTFPVKVKWIPWNAGGSGEYWQNGDIPFKVACYIAVFMVVSACFCVYATIKMANKIPVK